LRLLTVPERYASIATASSTAWETSLPCGANARATSSGISMATFMPASHYTLSKSRLVCSSGGFDQNSRLVVRSRGPTGLGRFSPNFAWVYSAIRWTNSRIEIENKRDSGISRGSTRRSAGQIPESRLFSISRKGLQTFIRGSIPSAPPGPPAVFYRLQRTRLSSLSLRNGAIHAAQACVQSQHYCSLSEGAERPK